jgi:hypothetical protein
MYSAGVRYSPAGEFQKYTLEISTETYSLYPADRILQLRKDGGCCQVVATWLCVGLGMFSFLRPQKYAKILFFVISLFYFLTVSGKDQGDEI